MATRSRSPDVRASLALAVTLALALVLAGCAKPDAGGAPSAVQRAVAAVKGQDVGSALGAIGGVVQSAALEPLRDARVTMLRENVSTRTDAAGAFRFSDLAPGSYLVTAEAAGFLARTSEAYAANGSTTTLDFTLSPIPNADPYHETQELKGLLSCALAAQTPVGDERRDCAAADPNHRDSFEFPIGAAAKSVTLELAWDASKEPAAKRLTLRARTVGYGANDLDLGNVTGEGYARLVVPVATMEKYYTEGGMMRGVVGLADDGSPPAGFAFQTKFTMYVTMFYVRPGPDGFSVVKSGA